jgi:hypothetical protein
MRLRPGLMKELHQVFELARDMCGSFDPDVMDDERASIRLLELEVRRHFRRHVEVETLLEKVLP